MVLRTSWKALTAMAAAAVLALAVAACGGDEGGGGGGSGEQVTLTWLVANAPDAVKPAEALSSAFEKQNPNVKIEIETRPQGGEGDNPVKTRLATQEMADLFSYNSGSLFQALRPQNVLTPLTDEAWVGKLDDAFKPSVTAGSDVYGAPFGSSLGGGVFYNKKI